jgi:hexosaminidase
MIDVSRHFQPLASIRSIIDSLAYAKMNVLHMHASDEQSWPVKLPPLATEHLLENTDGVGAPHHCSLHHCSLGAAPCYLLFMLTRALY